MTTWLPQIIPLTDFDGDYEKYFDHLHEIFLDDFARKQLQIDGLPIYYDDRVIDPCGKCECFIHLTTCCDKITGERNYDPRRSERLCWAKPTILNRDDIAFVKVWEVRKKGKNKVNILIESERYHVVLTRCNKSYVLNTAYYIDREHTFSKLIKEFKRVSGTG